MLLSVFPNQVKISLPLGSLKLDEVVSFPPDELIDLVFEALLRLLVISLADQVNDDVLEVLELLDALLGQYLQVQLNNFWEVLELLGLTE